MSACAPHAGKTRRHNTLSARWPFRTTLRTPARLVACSLPVGAIPPTTSPLLEASAPDAFQQSSSAFRSHRHDRAYCSGQRARVPGSDQRFGEVLSNPLRKALVRSSERATAVNAAAGILRIAAAFDFRIRLISSKPSISVTPKTNKVQKWNTRYIVASWPLSSPTPGEAQRGNGQQSQCQAC